MPPPSDKVLDADAIQAQINISVAHARRHIASWLPADTEDEKEKGPVAEKQDDFTLKPPRLGLGAPLPPEYQQKSIKKGPTTNDVLKRTLMGRKPPTTTHQPSKKNSDDHESSNDEDGRSAIGRPKRKRSEDREWSGEPDSQSKKSARFGTFLDVHHLNKKKKKHKKSKYNAAQQ